MAFEVSPAVDRITQAARDWAGRSGSDRVGPVHWLLALVEDDDGKPAGLLEQLGTTAGAVRAALSDIGTAVGIEPVAEVLHREARARSLTLRADPTLTTDVLLLAVLEAGPETHAALAPLGVTPDAIGRLLRTDSVGWEQDSFALGPNVEPAEIAELAPETVPAEPIRANHPPDLVAARVVDANLNRVREALRVIDDYCRFVLNDPALCGQTKRLRHRVAAAADTLPAGLLVAARDTPGDVGTAVGTASEYERRSPAQVAAVNLKRLQEALRSAEEFGKLLAPAFGRELEAIRYESYTLERALAVGAGPRERLAAAKLYVLVTAEHCKRGWEHTITEAAAGGADVIQLREKTGSDRQLLERALAVRRLTRELGVVFLATDRADIARAADADGVHLGQDDLPVAAARRIVGPDALVGVSTHTVEQVSAAVAAGADYLGVGPTFPSRTKPFAAFPGLDFVRAVTSLTTLPLFPLGGIDRHNLASVLDAGATRIAVAAAVTGADDPRAAAAALRQRLDFSWANSPEIPADENAPTCSGL